MKAAAKDLRNFNSIYKFLSMFTREDLRNVCRVNNLPVGRNKSDAIHSIARCNPKMAVIVEVISE